MFLFTMSRFPSSCEDIVTHMQQVSFIKRRPWTSLHTPLGFGNSKMVAFHGLLQGFSRPYALKLFIVSAIPSGLLVQWVLFLMWEGG